MAAALDGGQVVALKGLGGYHLACRADDEAATGALRARKHREDKPFALMARDLDGARALVELTAGEEELLTGRERPIVIARRLADARVADAVAPGAPDLGVMLPYTPLHHLLLAQVGGPLVMTSANVSDEPIAYRDDDARERLDGIADLLVSHDRPIHIRTDDSVVRSTALGPLMVRRARGYVPGSLELPVAAPVPITAYGAELKSTICVAKGERAWPSHHIGDLENWETLRSFREAIEHFERVFAVDARGRGPRHAPRVPVDQAGDGRSDPVRRGAAPPRPPGGLPGRARAHRSRPRRDLRRHRLRHRRHRVGRRAAGRRPGRLRARRATCGRSACPGASARSRSRGGWRARG